MPSPPLPLPALPEPVLDGYGTWEAWWKQQPDGAWYATLDGHLIHSNPALAQWLGCAIGPGDTWEKLLGCVHVPDRAVVQAWWQQPSGATVEARVTQPDGALRWLCWRHFDMVTPEGPRRAGLVTDVQQARAHSERLAQQAHRDELTGLPNRWAFAQTFTDKMQAARLEGSRLAVFIIDLDGFKQVNDSLGHADGDRALQRVASRLGMVFEGSPHHYLGRLGGDEFALVVSGPAAHDPMESAAQLLTHLRRPIRWHDQAWSVGACIGVARFPEDGNSVTDVLRCADTALYEAKAEGPHVCRLYHVEMERRVREKRDLAGALRQAIANQEFELHYQPKVHLQTGHWTGVEALLRWNRPGVGAVLPSFFIGALEETSLILPMGQWVIQEACRQMQAWQQQGLPNVRIAVNVSARQMAPEGGMTPASCGQDFEGMVQSILRLHPQACLDLELTETALMAHSARSVGLLSRLRDQGVRWSIDDFGTGYSSLAYLKRFPLNTLKIDRMFVRDLARNPDDSAIVSAIIGMAHSLRLNVVAEGVETEEQRDVLRTLGCDEIQGFLVTQPLSGVEMGAWLRQTPAYKASV